jgi:hypothetical protein
LVSFRGFFESYLSFHSSSFALRYFFHVNGNATVCHNPCFFCFFFCFNYVFQFLDIEILVNFSRKIETLFEFTVGKKRVPNYFWLEKTNKILPQIKTLKAAISLTPYYLVGAVASLVTGKSFCKSICRTVQSGLVDEVPASG